MAFPRPWAVADGSAGGIAIFAALLIKYNPQWESALIDLGWQIPLIFFFVLTGWRLLAAPYWIQQESEKRILELTNTNVVIDFRKDDCLSITPSKIISGHKIQGETMEAYLRLRLSVPGNRQATKCRADLVNIERADSPDGFGGIGYTDPYQLRWSGVPLEEQCNEIDIRPGIPKYVVLFAVAKSDNKLKLWWRTQPFKYDHLFDSPGRFRFTIRATSEEPGHPSEIKVVLDWLGRWDNFDVYKDGEEPCLEGNTSV